MSGLRRSARVTARRRRGFATRRDRRRARHPSRGAGSLHRRRQEARCRKKRPSAKRHPLDMWDEMRANAAAGRFPKGIDIFRHKFFGLFYVAPAQDAFMCRLRMPERHPRRASAARHRRHRRTARRRLCRCHDARQSADPRDRCRRAHRRADGAAGSRPHLARRRRRQHPQHHRQPDRRHRSARADRYASARARRCIITSSITASSTACRANSTSPSMAAARSACSRIPTTSASRRCKCRPAPAVPEGVYFRMLLGGITGHGDFARDAGVLLTPERMRCRGGRGGARLHRRRATAPTASARGSNTCSTRWGIEKFMAEVEKELSFTPFARCRSMPALPRGPVAKARPYRHPSAEARAGFCYVGIALPVGRLDVGAVARPCRHRRAARQRHDPAHRVAEPHSLGYPERPRRGGRERDRRRWASASRPARIRGGLVACTGNTGCKFAATDTKGQALAHRRLSGAAASRSISRSTSISPAARNSCAQHYVGDIGLLGIKVGDDMVEGYAIFVGGGAGSERRSAREIFPNVPMTDVPARRRSACCDLSRASARRARILPRFHGAPFGRRAEARCSRCAPATVACA